MSKRRRRSPDSRQAGVAGPAPEANPEPLRDVVADMPPEVDPAPDEMIIDLLVDDMALARAQLDAGQPGLAEGTLRQRIGQREAQQPSGDEELEALRTLLAEALWRQGRLASARASLDAVSAGSPQRRLPIASLIEAEALAAAGEPDRAVGALERVISAIGIERANELRGGVAGRLTWPLPAELQPVPARPPRPPWTDRPVETEVPSPAGDRAASALLRLEEARAAYVAGDLGRGDSEMSIAARVDPSLAGDGIAILEPTLGSQPAGERLILYGDLLRAAGRQVEA
ncbi:MAG: hypothetical protein ABIW50_01250, partial [Candidatus Limnocylindria bacterium]